MIFLISNFHKIPTNNSNLFTDNMNNIYGYRKYEDVQVGDPVHFNEGAYMGIIGKIASVCGNDLVTVQIGDGGSVTAYWYWLEYRY